MNEPKKRIAWTEEKIIEEAEALENWSKKDDSLHLAAFCDERDYDPTYIGRFTKQNETFMSSLKKVKNKINIRLRNKLNAGEYNYGLFMREIGMYDFLLNQHEREEKQFDAQLKSLTVDNIPIDLKESFNALMCALKSTQSSDLKIADNSESNEIKS